MSYPICFIKNISGETKTLHEKQFAINEEYKIEDMERINWASDDTVLSALASEEFAVGMSPAYYWEALTDQIDWLKNYY